MPYNLIDCSKEIIMKLNFFTERGFIEDQKSWDEKLNPILDVFEILLQLMPNFIEKEHIEKMSENPDQKIDFMYLRIKFAGLILLINEFTDHIIEASGDRKFSDDLDIQFQRLKKQNETQFNALDIERSKIEKVKELIRDICLQKEELETRREESQIKQKELETQQAEIQVMLKEQQNLHEEIQIKVKELENLRGDLSRLYCTDSSLRAKIEVYLNQEPGITQIANDQTIESEDINITK